MSKKMTYEDVVREVEKIKEDLQAYKRNPKDLPDSFSYPQALKRLHFLRNSITRRKKASKDD